MEDKRQEVMRGGSGEAIRWHWRGHQMARTGETCFKKKRCSDQSFAIQVEGDHLDGIQIKVANRCCGMGYDYEQIRVGWVGGCGGCSRRYKWVPDCCEWPTQEGTQGVTSHSLLIVLIVNISQGLLLNFRISDILTVLNHHASSIFWLHLALMAHC